MASGPGSGDHGSPNNKLNGAISEFAASFIKKELEQLASDYDEVLARVHVPKIRHLLMEVDEKRQAFDDAKNGMVQTLRKKLEALEVDGSTINSALSDLQKMCPDYLDAIPRASVLNIRPGSPTTSSSSDSRLSSPGDSLDIAIDQDNSASLTQPVDDENPNVDGHRRSPNKVGGNSRAGMNIDRDVEEQPMAETLGTKNSQKRSRDEAFESETDEGMPLRKGLATKTGINFPRKISAEEVNPEEIVFQHSGLKGYYVIRCDQASCASLHFTEPPLIYRRAVKHFERHRSDNASEPVKELTEQEVFENYAIEVKGVEDESREWLAAHTGGKPHIFTPKPRRVSAGIKQGDSAKKTRKEPEDKNYTPSTHASSLISANDSHDDEYELETENPRRHLRRVPRQDYAELVMGKSARDIPATTFSDFGRASSRSATTTEETDTRSTPKSEGFKSPNSRFKLMDASKPFGYFGEWPRRSAPR
ncbi:hypothetical protein DL766_004531 [Monosporascus sp. MC13-8B]|uniref:Inhibitor of growth protein N-terminal histone-binding domain-containing protein n=1 Tax=Monosporascus cannonballus TaxID=155416 RepID=A0ABY0HID8_9PEZI|nr:hypothetical protein DL763_005719 [Monosporascus cannonballus]RYO94149.1 hypothetical protein DL762_000659 [Monosporascus cannonballus]RYP31101.1 hypothetical protein DL766_004531 [Monosporascus sp. MC13-8B]